MATKNQYDICRSSYDEEMKRYTELTEKGKIFLQVCTFFIGGSALKFNDVFTNSPRWAYWTFALAFASFAVSFMFIVSSMALFPYEAMFDPWEYIANLGPKPPTEEEFMDDRISDIALACQRNVEENDHRAQRLRTATYAMFAGIVLGFVSLIMVYLHRDVH